MLKRIISLILTLCIVQTGMTAAVSAKKASDEDEIAKYIGEIQSVYVPDETYFVANSKSQWVGEDNTEGDKTQACLTAGTTNSHGRFGGLWQSMGFANYVFYNVFGEMPSMGYHCNPRELNDKVEIIGRLATDCRHLKGETTGEVTRESVKELLGKAKQGDIIVAAPPKRCNITGRAMVVMEASDAHVKVYQADFKGGCAVTEDDITYDALAQYHCLTLLRSADYPYPEPVPPAAVEGVAVSGNDFSLNENVSVIWQKNKNTEKYKVSLVDENGSVIEEKEQKSVITSFVFKNAGRYKVKINAVNEYGESTDSYSEEITVHNYNKVSFYNYDGTLITVQNVEYGKKAVAPNAPYWEGHIFIGWDKSLENIVAPCSITATYEVEKYTVKYYDVGGKRVLSSETVEYQGQATPPENYTIDDGFVFSGWQISFDSVGTDYTCVDGDMSLIATQKWADMELPISITAENAQRNEEGTFFTADLEVTNHHETESHNIKLLGTLKASDGKALKSVVLSELVIDPGETVSLPETTIVYSEKASTMEFVAVGMVGNSKTGGAYSRTEAAEIFDPTSWGPWSEWTTEDLKDENEGYEEKRQYRARNKIYTTADTKALDGWEHYKTTESVGEWITTTSEVTAFETDAQKREVTSEYIPAVYKTQYHYYRYYYPGIKATSNFYSSRTSRYSAFEEYWSDYPLEFSGYYIDRDYLGKAGSPYWFPCDGSIPGGFVGAGWTRVVQTGGDYTEYTYRDTYYTHYFWRWSDFSDWSDEALIGDEIEERTVYRYRNTDTSGDSENSDGEIFTVEGNINNVEEDFSGLYATIMVYKKSNTDPTEEQLEYVGETVIGEENFYSFEFKPREMPTAETGDFIVALGTEGADRLVNVGVIKAELPKYQVKFLADGKQIEDSNAVEITNSSGETVLVQLVEEGMSAIAPEAPEKEGYRFVKWNESLTGIKSDKVFIAEYEPVEYSLVFIDWENNKIETRRLKHGEAIVYPELGAVEGVKARAWDKQQEGIAFAYDNMISCTVSELKTYNVTFMDAEGNMAAQTVEHGKAAVLPEETPEMEGMTFAGWVGECSADYITCDASFAPTFIYASTAAMPTAEIVSTDENGTSTISLSCSTEGAEIYYIIHTHGEESMETQSLEEEMPIMLLSAEETELTESEDGVATEEETDEFKAAATKYTGEITLESNQTVTFIAYAEGMNESIPVSETAAGESTYYSATVEENTLRMYKSSVEGSLTLKVVNEKPEYEDGTFTLCFYDHRGVMLDIIPVSCEILPGDNVIEFSDIALAGTAVKNADSISCKVISWLYGEKVTPISDVIEFELD